MPHMNNGNNGPIKRSEYDSIPFKNKAIDTLKKVKLPREIHLAQAITLKR